jgi:hypothetical protein
MSEFRVEKSAEVNAPLDKIWEEIIKVGEWPKWKPFVTKASIAGGYEALTNGSTFKMSLKVGGPAAVPLSAKITEFDRPRSLKWGGGVKGLLTAEHGFRFEEQGGKVKVTSWEHFSGALLGFVLLMVSKEDLEKLHEDWVAAIKARFEGKPAEADHGHHSH